MEVFAPRATVRVSRTSSGRSARRRVLAAVMTIAVATPCSSALGQEHSPAPATVAPSARLPEVANGYIDPELSPRPAVHPTRVTRAPVIDGRLDEQEWQGAELITGFRQQLPRTGFPATFPTVVRALYDDEHLYIGAENMDPEPQRAITAGLERDFASSDSDLFGMVFDTFLDRRNAFLFLVNPHGAVRDEQVFNDSRTVVDAWEGIIQVRTRMTDSSWIAEIAIPLRSLRFDGSKPVQDWGANFIRRVRRVNETSYWAPLERQYRLHRMSKAGTLERLEGLRSGRNLQIKPYLVGGDSRGTQVPTSAQGTSQDAGVDLKYGVTPSMTLDATYNTDFSQVEVDQEQVNLTRFSLFFPERREFFIENAGSFTFGDVEERNYRMGASLRDLTLFNSRRIGLTNDGRPIPIVGGGRLTGRAGPWELGLLEMQTQRSSNSSTSGAAENFGVLRARRNLWGNSDVGALVQRRGAIDGSGAENLSYGVDANLRPVGNLIINAYAAASEAAGRLSDGHAERVSVAYRDAFWNTSVMAKQVSDAFDPGLGFVRRRGMQQGYATIGVHTRPAWRGIQEVAPYVSFDHIADERGQLDTRTVEAGVEVQFRPDGKITLELQDQFDRLDVPFSPVTGRAIPAGAYGWREATMTWESSRARPVFWKADATTGGFYDGSRKSYGTTVTWRARYDLMVEANYTRNDVTLASGPFQADVGRLRLRYAWSTRLFGSAFVQYNAQSNTMVTNARINFRYAPLSDIFLVYTDRRNQETGVLGERTLALKATRMLAF